MRKIALLLPLLVLPILINAQKSPIDKLFKKYYGKEGVPTDWLDHLKRFDRIYNYQGME